VRIGLFALLAFTMLVALGGGASAQYGGWVEPQWNSRGSAVCPERYDFDQGWCKPRRNRGYDDGPGYRRYGGGPGYHGGDAVPPRWTYDGSAVCPGGYDYLGGGCRRRSPGFEYGALPPRWNRWGQAVCPQHYDYIAGRCRPRG